MWQAKSRAVTRLLVKTLFAFWKETNMNTLYPHSEVGANTRPNSPLSITSNIKRVTPQMAETWLKQCKYERQRNVRPHHVEFLAEEMRRGNFRQGTQIHFTEYEGKLHLVNGQHTLSAIIKSDLPQILDICQTDEDPSVAYYRHDNGLKRTPADMFSAMYIAEEFGITKTQTNALGAAVRFIAQNFKQKPTRSERVTVVHPDDQLGLMREYGEYAEAYFDIAAGRPKHMRSSVERAATLSVALVTLRYAYPTMGDVVTDFWKGAIFDDGLSAGDARKAANVHLLTTGMGGGGQGYTIQTKTSEYSARYIARCWNAWVEKREISFTKVLDQFAPIIIRGTPFTGKA